MTAGFPQGRDLVEDIERAEARTHARWRLGPCGCLVPMHYSDTVRRSASKCSSAAGDGRFPSNRSQAPASLSLFPPIPR